MNIQEQKHTVMLIMRKEDYKDVSRFKKCSHVLANINPDIVYSKIDKTSSSATFKEACFKVMTKYEDVYKDTLGDGFTYIIISVPFCNIKMYGTPVFISTDRVHPERYATYNVEQAEVYLVEKYDKMRKKKKHAVKDLIDRFVKNES